MGFFSKMKQRRAEKEALEQAAAQQGQLGTWQTQSEQLDVMINAVERCGNNDIEGLFDPYDTGFILKKVNMQLVSSQIVHSWKRVGRHLLIRAVTAEFHFLSLEKYV